MTLAKGKIERFFQTVQSRFLDQPEVAKITQLAALNRAFFAWAEEYNNRHHSALGCTPMEKWLKSPRPVRLLPNNPTTDDLFLLEVTRRVKKDGTFSLAGVRFEISYIYAGRKATVRYDHADLSKAHVYADGQYLGIARPLNPIANNQLPRHPGK
jgi:hypothetical protein